MSNYIYQCKNKNETEKAITYLTNMGYEDKRCSPRDNHILAFECGGMKQILSYDATHISIEYHIIVTLCPTLRSLWIVNQKLVNCNQN